MERFSLSQYKKKKKKEKRNMITIVVTDHLPLDAFLFFWVERC